MEPAASQFVTVFAVSTRYNRTLGTGWTLLQQNEGTASLGAELPSTGTIRFDSCKPVHETPPEGAFEVYRDSLTAAQRVAALEAEPMGLLTYKRVVAGPTRYLGVTEDGGKTVMLLPLATHPLL